MILATIKYAESKDWDGEASRDADFCLKALQKRFPTLQFFKTNRKLGTYTIEGRRVSTTEFPEVRGFAEGFMASATLWER